MVSISPVFLYCFYFFFACALTRQRACCPCNLQVVAARVRVHINDFPGEYSPLTFLLSIVAGSISRTFTPPRVTMGFLDGR